MEIEIGRGKKARRAYGFDDIAIVPSRRTRDPDDVDISWTLGPYRFELPLLASAMDGVVSPETDRVRRRRRDDRLAARSRVRGARPRLPLGHGDVPPVAPARRAGADGAERHDRADPDRPRARERRLVQPHGRAAD